MSGDFAIPNLPLNRFRLTFQAKEDMQLPAFAGPLWRSVLGPQIKQAGEVLFQKLFETETPPFVIATPVYGVERYIEQGESFHFELILFGYANDITPVILEGYSRAAQAGLGKQRYKSELIDVETIWHANHPDRAIEDYKNIPAPVSPIIPPMPSRVCVQFTSPMCLKMKEKKSIIMAHQFNAYDLFDKLVRRVSILMSTYTDQKLETDFRYLKSLGRRAEAEDALLRDCNLKRWSARQQKEVPLTGIIGTFTLNMASSPELWPYLWLGQWTHAGKNTSMGCGGYVVLPE